MRRSRWRPIPGTFEREKFAGFRAAGVNRLSLGIQSFDDRAARARSAASTTRDEAQRAAEAALAIFGNVNLDLMYALPRQTVDEARADLATALAFAPPHLSFYHLTLEPNTLFHRHPPPLPDDDTAADIEDAVDATLAAAGYVHYETSALRASPAASAGTTSTTGSSAITSASAPARIPSSRFPTASCAQLRYKQPKQYLEQVAAGAPLQESHRGDARRRRLRVHAERAAADRRRAVGAVRRAHRAIRWRSIARRARRGDARAACSSPIRRRSGRRRSAGASSTTCRRCSCASPRRARRAAQHPSAHRSAVTVTDAALHAIAPAQRASPRARRPRASSPNRSLARIAATDARDRGLGAPRSGRTCAPPPTRCDARRPAERGPLHGIGIGVKDIIATADMPTQMGSPVHAGHRPVADAACVARLKAAGGYVFGKTVTTAYAFLDPGKTRNPWHPAHTPGGSSSGSAAAVAALPRRRGARHADQRLGDPAGRVLRRRRVQADARRDPARRRPHLQPDARPGRDVHAQRRRRGAARAGAWPRPGAIASATRRCRRARRASPIWRQFPWVRLDCHDDDDARSRGDAAAARAPRWCRSSCPASGATADRDPPHDHAVRGRAQPGAAAGPRARAAVAEAQRGAGRRARDRRRRLRDRAAPARARDRRARAVDARLRRGAGTAGALRGARGTRLHRRPCRAVRCGRCWGSRRCTLPVGWNRAGLPLGLQLAAPAGARRSAAARGRVVRGAVARSRQGPCRSPDPRSHAHEARQETPATAVPPAAQSRSPARRCSPRAARTARAPRRCGAKRTWRSRASSATRSRMP